MPVGTRGSDIDHLAVGPGGVVTINSKFHDGATVWLGSRRLLVNGQKTDHLRNARYEGTRVAKMLSAASGFDVPVRPVVALVGIRRLTVKTRPDDVSVLRDGELARWFRKRPTVLTMEQIERIRQIVTSSTFWGTAPEAPDASAFDRLRQSVQRAHRIRLSWASGATVAVIAAATVAAQPYLSMFLLTDSTSQTPFTRIFCRKRTRFRPDPIGAT